ncbi:hypothetical protein ABEB36_006559 [Hypothenemus hampei]|uniref:Uncharacterized protein n=1 Tax=Hypothenemus hampei TaxID=57062 RepID=A0ABD1ETX4_HYPHA
MEQILKIKTRTNPDFLNQYPSERRYSASKVLGLSIFQFIFTLLSILMGILLIHKRHVLNQQQDQGEPLTLLSEKLQQDLQFSDHKYLHYYKNISKFLIAACFIMAFCNFLAFCAGILAWKRWYIDHNIAFFCMFCCVSTLTSFTALVIAIITGRNANFIFLDNIDRTYDKSDLSPVNLTLAVNIIVLSLFSTIWSIISMHLACRGMRNSYPDDMMVAKRGGIELKNNVVHLNVINRSAIEKIRKCLLKRENNNGLPKQESSAEYLQRVDNFLNSFK